MNRKLLGLFAMLALAAGCLSTTAAESDSEAEPDNEAELAAAAELASAADPYFHCTDDNTSDPNATPWFNNHYDASWALSRSLLDQHIPQGLATWKNYYGSGKDLLVYTAYSQYDGRARIQGIDEADGSLTNYARIRKGHAGGVAIIGQWAFVSGPDATSVYRYRLDKLADVFAGRASDDVLDGALAGTVDANSFLASEGSVLYAGEFNQYGLGTMHRYAVNLTTGELGAAGAAIQVPKKTQGLTVLPNYFIFSTSWGRHNRSNVYVVERGYSTLQTSYDNGNLRCVRIPTMSEGVTLSNNRVYQLFESGADCYRYNEPECYSSTGTPDRVITHLYRTPRITLVDGLPVLH
jgi:hypothetical protein